ncbi:MAG: beta-ketoacyl synthase N-terminal-like domain-containing protein [Chloroflexi bacterium]|nr:beta-ketoacyl synthase N-terminal-like domain-containing protein [Chloroflexota bacterium]
MSSIADAIVVAGVGMMPVGEHWDLSLRHLALDAISAARADSGGLRPQALYVANVLAPALSGQSHLGALLADFTGLRGVEASTIEASGASGGVAVRQAYLALTSGALDVAIVLGVEKITDKASGQVQAALATSTDSEYEAVHGVTPSTQAALLMQRYLYEHGAPKDSMAGFSMTAHQNAVTNPNAMFRKAIRHEQYARAPIISEPLNTFDVAPLGDGAAALVLARAAALPNRHDYPQVVIAGSAVSTSALAVHDRPNPLHLTAASQSAEAAMLQASLSLEDIGLFELHDSFSIFAALSLEAAGFAAPGHGWKLAQNGDISLAGKIPISTFGGSKARGDPGAATGIYQLAEATLQLQGRANENQVPNAAIAMTQCLGGSGATASTHILRRPN